MTDVILVAAIVAFFAVAAFIVRVLDRMIEGSRSATEDSADDDPDGHTALEPGRRM